MALEPGLRFVGPKPSPSLAQPPGLAVSLQGTDEARRLNPAVIRGLSTFP
jgi:hypothetical protein